MTGARIVRASWLGTALFAVTAVAAAVAGSPPLEAVAVAVDLVLFALGCVVFLAAFFRAVGRSRTEEVAVAGVYLLMGQSAPNDVRRSLLGSLAVQVAVAVATAAARPFTPLAFGILVPTYGLALAGLWAASHGTFPPRVRPDPRNRR